MATPRVPDRQDCPGETVSKDQGLPIASAGSIAMTMTNVLGGYPVMAANQVISGAQILVAEGRAERVAQVMLTACVRPTTTAQAARMGDPDGDQDSRRDIRDHAAAPVPRGQPGSGGWGGISRRPVPPRSSTAGSVLHGPAPDPQGPGALRAFHSGPADAPAPGRGDAVLPRPGSGRLGRRGQANSRGHGRWLAGFFTDAKLVEIEDSCTLIPEDQPERLARELREFVKA